MCKILNIMLFHVGPQATDVQLAALSLARTYINIAFYPVILLLISNYQHEPMKCYSYFLSSNHFSYELVTRLLVSISLTSKIDNCSGNILRFSPMAW